MIISSISILNINYTIDQIYNTINKLVDNKLKVTDKYNTEGTLIKINDIIIFQPSYISNNNASYYEKSTPINTNLDKVIYEIPKDFDISLQNDEPLDDPLDEPQDDPLDETQEDK